MGEWGFRNYLSIGDTFYIKLVIMDQFVIVQMSLCLENLVTILTLNVILGVNTIHMLCQMVFCNKNLTTLITSFLFFAMTSHMSVEV